MAGKMVVLMVLPTVASLVVGMDALLAGAKADLTVASTVV